MIHISRFHFVTFFAKVYREYCSGAFAAANIATARPPLDDSSLADGERVGFVTGQDSAILDDSVLITDHAV